MDVFDFIKEEVRKKLSEKGLRVEPISDILKDESKSIFGGAKMRKPDLAIKSGGVIVGYLFISLPDENIDELLNHIKDLNNTENFKGATFYVVIDRSKEKIFMAKVMSLGLTGKVKFISWELKLYNI